VFFFFGGVGGGCVGRAWDFLWFFIFFFWEGLGVPSCGLWLFVVCSWVLSFCFVSFSGGEGVGVFGGGLFLGGVGFLVLFFGFFVFFFFFCWGPPVFGPGQLANGSDFHCR